MARARTSQPTDSRGVQRFGPNVYWWLMLLLAAALIAAVGWLNLLLLSEGSFALFPLVWFCIQVFILIKAIEAGSVFSLDDEGVEQKRLSGRSFVPWEELRRVGNREIGVGGHSDEYPAVWGDRGRFQEGSTDRSAFMFLVHDMDGAIVFRIPPWIRKRKELVREIQARTRRHRAKLNAPSKPAGGREQAAYPAKARAARRRGLRVPRLRRRRVRDRSPGDALGAGMKWVWIQVFLAAICLFYALYGGGGAWGWAALVALLAWRATRLYRWLQR